jgi:hypothetical protein
MKMVLLPKDICKIQCNSPSEKQKNVNPKIDGKHEKSYIAKVILSKKSNIGDIEYLTSNHTTES